MVGDGGSQDLFCHVGPAQQGQVVAGPVADAGADRLEFTLIQSSAGHLGIASR